jgi:NTE family protein
LFTPVDYKGRKLIDGGVVRNMAIDVALEMGAETIIAVDVGSKMGEMEKKKSTSAMKVLHRTRSIMSQAVRAEQLELIREEDILITPDLDGKVTFSDFEEVEIAVAEGRAAAQALESRLQALSVSPQNYEPFLQRQRSGVKPGGIPIAEVEVRGLNRVPRERILYRIETKPGTTLDLETLAEDLQRVYLIGEFQTVEFALEPAGDKVRLVIDATEKSWGPWYVRAGLALEANFEGTGNFQANLLLRRAEVNKLGAEWKSVVTIGDVDGIQTELYQPLSQRGTWFVAPGISAYRNDDERFNAGDEVKLANTKRMVATLDVGRALRQWGEIRLGVWGGKVEDEVIGEVEEENDVGAYRLQFAADRLDNAFFPREGTYGLLDSRFSRESLGADDEYDRLRILLIKAGSIGQASRNTLLGKIELGTDFNSGLPFYDEFRLGGFLNLSGLKRNQLRGPDLGLATLVFYRQVNREPGFLGNNYYIGGSLETGNIWQADEDVSFDNLRLAGSIFVGAETVFGPIYFGYGKADQQRSTFYVFLGRLF